MSESPPLTIGLPVYNSQRFLKRSLDSLLGQTYRNFVLVISDNASTDGTADICKSYASSDSRIRYHRNAENIGNPRNFNRIVELTSTPYLKWSTSDDYWAPTFVERAMEVMERDPSVALCYPRTNLVHAESDELIPFDDGLNLPDEDPAVRFMAVLDRIKLAHQHLGVIRMSCLRQTHLLGTYVASDITLLAELALYGKFHELPERLFYRRFHETSGSWNRTDAGHQAKYYYGNRTRDKQLATWRGHLGRMTAVRTSPLPIGSKIKLTAGLVHRMIWDRRNLVGELMSYARPATG